MPDETKTDEKTKREYTDDMAEVSGLGGAYEACCRAMVLAGVDWLEANPRAVPELRCIYCDRTEGRCNRSRDGLHAFQRRIPALEVAVVAGALRAFPGSGSPTGAMVGAAVQHAWSAGRELGWDAYAAEMRKIKRERDAEKKGE